MRSNKKKYQNIIIITLLGVITVWGTTFLLFNIDDEFRGAFGDMFGAVNALFSGLAFAGIILSMYMQRDDLKNQRKELKLQREELKLQRKEQEETRIVFKQQAQIMTNQQNDSVFFNLLTNHRQLVESFKTSRSNFQRKNPRASEIVSGYQVLEETADYWADFFIEYSEMYTYKVLWDIKIASINVRNYVYSNNNVETLVDELVHIANFIENRFIKESQLKFYRDTLSHNVLDSEKFILAAWSAILLDRQSVSPFGMELYDSLETVDLAKVELPSFEIRIETSFTEIDRIELRTSGLIHKCYFVIEQEPSSKDERNIEITRFDHQKNVDSLDISVLDFARGTSIDIQSFPFEESKLRGMSLREYYIIVEVLFKNEAFHVPFNFHLESREAREASKGELRFYELSLRNNNISKARSIDLVGRIEKINANQTLG